MNLKDAEPVRIIGTGVLVIFVGIVVDTYYHTQVSGGEPTRAILFGHSLFVIGILIASYGSLHGYRTKSGYQKKALLAMTAVAAFGAVGRALDDAFHLMDQHTTVYNTIGHALWGVGFFGILLTLIAMYVLPRWISDGSKQAA